MHDRVTDTAQQRRLDGGCAARADHDQLGGDLIGDLEDLLAGAGLVAFQAGLDDELVPLLSSRSWRATSCARPVNSPSGSSIDGTAAVATERVREKLSWRVSDVKQTRRLARQGMCDRDRVLGVCRPVVTGDDRHRVA